jgi:hypothetical protein
MTMTLRRITRIAAASLIGVAAGWLIVGLFSSNGAVRAIGAIGESPDT